MQIKKKTLALEPLKSEDRSEEKKAEKSSVKISLLINSPALPSKEESKNKNLNYKIKISSLIPLHEIMNNHLD